MNKLIINILFIFSMTNIFAQEEKVIWRFSFNLEGKYVTVSNDTIFIGNNHRNHNESILLIDLNSGKSIGKKDSLSILFDKDLINSEKTKTFNKGRKFYYYVNLPIKYKYDKVLLMRKSRFFRWNHETHKLILFNGFIKKYIKFDNSYYYDIYDIKALNYNYFLIYYLRKNANTFNYEIELIQFE